MSPFGLREQSSRALPTWSHTSWIFLCDRLHSWRHNSQSCAWGKSEKRREPCHPSSIVGMISFWVITLVPQHSETHPQVINPRLSTISLSGSHETCRIHVVVLESWREFEWCHLLDPATNPKLASYPTTLFLSTYTVFSKKSLFFWPKGFELLQFQQRFSSFLTYHLVAKQGSAHVWYFLIPFLITFNITWTFKKNQLQ